MNQNTLTKAIWKYPLPSVESEVLMPFGSTVLDVQVQDGIPTLWAEVDPRAESMPRHFRILATGQEFERHGDLAYIATIQTMIGLVWHVYEERGK